MLPGGYTESSESTKDNIIQIQTGGTVSKERVMSVYLRPSVAIDSRACNKAWSSKNEACCSRLF